MPKGPRPWRVRCWNGRLVACVALTPLRSLYRWQGAIETAEEVQLLLKTHASRLADLESAVRALHSYDTPEWIHWPGRPVPPTGGGWPRAAGWRSSAQPRWDATRSLREPWGRGPSWVTTAPAQSDPSRPQRSRLSPRV